MTMSIKTTRLVFSSFAIALILAGSINAQRVRLISDIQGAKEDSVYVGNWLRVSGLVTARVRNGFFIQTPDEKIDKDPNTSEGIFVFTRTEPGEEAAIGNYVSVTGTVGEYTPSADTMSPSITQISFQVGRDFISVESKGNQLPKPIMLSPEDFRTNSNDQLEKYESMRVAVGSLVVVGPTGGFVNETTGTAVSDGVFYGVLKGTPRPFRQTGFDVLDFKGLDEKEIAKLKKETPRLLPYDSNPERLRIQSSTQIGSKAIDVNVGAEITDLVGVLYYGYRSYALLADPTSPHKVSGGQRVAVLPIPQSNEFTVAGMNIERLFDEVDDADKKDPIIPVEVQNRRLEKLSLAIRQFMHLPDVIGVAEVENLKMLQRLAEKINSDSVAAGKSDPKYLAFLSEGNDVGGIDNGFLVKSSTIRILEIKQLGKDDKFQNPASKEDAVLNDRPPLLLRAAFTNKKTGKEFEFTVIVNHMKSLNGYNDPKEGIFVRTKKQLQAEMLAKVVAARLKNNPGENIALVGDFNAFEFSDGVTDVMNTVKGTPTPKDQVMYWSEDLVPQDLINIIERINPVQRYSYVFQGNAQTLDHFVITQSMFRHLMDFQFARLNADYSEILRNDSSRVERFSDHDVTVAYFGFE
jgi:predicted extracellular nuclease